MQQIITTNIIARKICFVYGNTGHFVKDCIYPKKILANLTGKNESTKKIFGKKPSAGLIDRILETADVTDP